MENLLAYTKTQDWKNIISQNRDKLNAAGIKTQQFTDDQIIKRLKKQGIKTDNLTSYDLDNYLNNERGFYLDYKKDLPGPIVCNSNELINVILEGIDNSNSNSFLLTFFF